jgi:hypothetical protein
MNSNIITTRFNKTTWKENIRGREKYKYKCIYGSPCKIKEDILYNTIIFVIEMNNDTNMIEGIGIIKNKIIYDKYYKIYSIGNYNRYIYIGNYYLNREQIIQYNYTLVLLIELLLFKDKNHLKRGYGFTSLTEQILNKISNQINNKKINNQYKYNIIMKNIKKCFILYYKQNKQ